MSIGRWDPFGELVSLREAMNNLLEESFVQPRSGGGARSSAGGAAAPAGLALDIHETPEAFVVTASVPGVRPEDVDITVLGDALRISGQQRDERQEHGQGGSRWILRERRFGTFERLVRLPTAVKSNAAEAEFKNGVLTVTLPKAEEAKPRSIPIRVSQTQDAHHLPIDVTGGGQNQPVSIPAEGQGTPAEAAQPS